MRLGAAMLAICVPLAAQQAPTPAASQSSSPQPQAQQSAPPGPVPAATPAASENAPNPVPAGEPAFTGVVDFGFRWVTTGGSTPAYRSIVGLNQGPKLTGADFTLLDPKHRLFDRLEVRGYNWGDDPYSTAHVGARRLGLYDLTFDYRSFAYFNDLPSFADPLLSLNGLVLNERAFDLRRRLADFNLDLRPGKRLIPFFAFDSDSDQGHGVANLVLDVNEYPAPLRIDNAQRSYRGGLRIELNRFHATAEQGGTTYGDSEQLGGSNLANLGNRRATYLGQTLEATSILDAYDITGHSLFTRVLVTANPFSWIDLSGQFLYSQPENDVRFTQDAQGNFVLLSALLFYNGQSELATGTAKLPHVTADFGTEIRPFHRLRILESFTTDRMHNASAAALTDQYFVAGALAVTQGGPAADRLTLNYNREEVNVLFDVLPRLTLRGGYRREWGDADVRTPALLSAFGPLESGQLARNTGLAGVSFRPVQKLSTSVDFEGASSEHDYFRTSLRDYQRLHARARYQATTNLSASADFSYLHNRNPDPGVDYSFDARQSSLSLMWTPNGSKYVSILGDYTRSAVDSAITYLVPQFLTPERYIYRDNAHIASALVDLNLPRHAGMTGKLTLGGSLFISNGSRPTRYYQPYIRAVAPLYKHVYWTAEWRYYGFGENFYMYEGFRAHLITTGLRLTR